MPTGHTIYHLPDPFIPILLLKMAVDSSTVVNLDEVKVSIVEILVGILHVVHPKSGTQTIQILVVA